MRPAKAELPLRLKSPSSPWPFHFHFYQQHTQAVYRNSGFKQKVFIGAVLFVKHLHNLGFVFCQFLKHSYLFFCSF